MAQPTSTDYSSYTIPNSELVKTLKLNKHPEGGSCSPERQNYSIEPNDIDLCAGYYAETDRQSAEVPSPFAGMILDCCDHDRCIHGQPIQDKRCDP